jgi:hypothetical protein
MQTMTRLGTAVAILSALSPPVYAGALIWEAPPEPRVIVAQEPPRFICGTYRVTGESHYWQLEAKGLCSGGWSDLNDAPTPGEPPRERPKPPPPPPPPPPCGWECTE